MGRIKEQGFLPESALEAKRIKPPVTKKSQDTKRKLTWEEVSDITHGTAGGWMTVQEREFFLEYIPDLPTVSTFLEIGVFGGANLILAAAVHPTVTIYGMDSWENQTEVRSRKGHQVTLREFCHENIEVSGYSHRIKLFDGRSQDLGATWPYKLDMLIIDGDHTFSGLEQDLKLFSPFVKKGGIMVVDDYWSETPVKNATDSFINDNEGAWSDLWGQTETPRNETGGVLYKLRAFRRK